jgi:type I restriction enzyme, S subunit
MVPEGWGSTTLRTLIASIDAGTSVNSEDRRALPDEIAVLKTSAAFGGRFHPSKHKVIIDADLHRVTCPVRGGTILLSRMNTKELVGENGYVPVDHPNLYLPDRLWALLPTHDTAAKWLAHLLASPMMREQLGQRATGTSGSMKNISQEGLLGIGLIVPPLPEQRRIAAVLDAWDNAIATAERLVAAKRSLERRAFCGMSALWPTVRLGSLGRFVGGGTPSKARPDFWGGPVPWVSSKDMSGWQISETEDTIAEEAVKRSTTQVVPAGSVLIVVRSGILRHTVPVTLAMRPVAINQDIKALLVATPYSGALIGRILVLENERLRGATVKTGTTVESIDLAGLREFEIPFPDSADADMAEALLLDFRREHELAMERVQLLRHQKRGLMQQLLTGKLRVPESIDRLMPVPALDAAA